MQYSCWSIYIVELSNWFTAVKMAAKTTLQGNRIELSTCYGHDISGTGVAVERQSGLLIISRYKSYMMSDGVE